MTELPHSIEAEEYLLSSLFAAGAMGVSMAINAGVSPASFFAEPNATLFGAILTLAERGQAPTIQAVLHELNFAKTIGAAGGMPNVLRVAKLVPTHVNLSLYIGRVRELQLLRAIARATRALHEESFTQEANVPEFAERVERTIVGLAQDRANPARTWAQAVAEVRTEFEAMLLAKPNAVLAGEVSWGFSDMDRFFGPLAPGQLVILAARPSVGKSSLMRQTAYDTLKTGKAAYIASLEVKDRAIARNMAQALSGISYRGLRAGAHPADADDFRRALAQVESLQLRVSDDFSATVSQICAQARLAKAKSNLGLVCVDHLHELAECKNPPKGTNTAQAYGRAVKAFKELAGELEVPVLVLAQLNRGSESDKRVPTLSDLRDSGNIEEAADKVVLLHRPPETNAGIAQSETSNPRECPTFFTMAIQAKGRDDGTSSIGLSFQRASARFVQLAPAK